MQTKAYFASSVPAALEVARQELGEDALLVKSRPSPPEMRAFGRLEVTFAFDPRLDPAKAARPAAQPLPTRVPDNPEIDDIRRQLADLRTALGRGSDKPSLSAVPRNSHDGTVTRLVDCGLSRITAAEIASAAATRDGDPEAAVLAELSARIKTAPTAIEPGECRTLAFVGPPGRGKTTSLVKIAFQLGIAQRIPVRIYSAGAHGVGAADQLARYASILGTPFLAFESLQSLHLALNGDTWNGLILIDTPGIAPADTQELAELEAFFSARTALEMHLVLRADATSTDLYSVVTRFSGLNPSRLLFTGMDETQSVASVAETLIRTGITASFFGNGQRIPDDLDQVIADKIAWELWSDTFSGVSAARAAA